MNTQDLDRLLLLFLVDEQRYALRLAVVQRVLAMMEVTALPAAPAVVMGAIDVAGTIVPVMDLRARLRLPPREPRLSDVLIIARANTRTVALPADGVSGVLDVPWDEVVPASAVAPGLAHLAGVAKLPDGLVLIHDLQAFLSLPEQEQLEHALQGRARIGTEPA